MPCTPRRLSTPRVQAVTASTLIIAALGAPALAQSDGPPLDPLFACAQISSDAERLSCYDSAIAALRTQVSTGDLRFVDQDAARQAARESFGLRGPEATGATLDAALQPAVSPELLADVPTPPIETEPAAPSEAPTQPQTPPSSTTPPAPTQGAESASPVSTAEAPQTAVEPERPSETAEPAEPDSVRLVISEVRERPYGEKRFFMENGQVWEQVGSENVRIPRNNNGETFAVIRRAAFGSFLMKINDQGRAFRVRRVQ